MSNFSTNIQGIIWILIAMFVFSLQNVIIKSISTGYPVLQIVIIRCLVALPLTIMLFWWEGGRKLPQTTHYRMEFIRGLLLFLSYTTYFMGLAALPLAAAASIRFSAPLMITALSVLMLHEMVGPRRWVALLIGFMGVLFIVQPGTANFNMGSLFIATATFFYALSTMFTRRLKEYDSSATMAYFSTLVYLAAAFILAPLALRFGEVSNAHPSIEFLLRPWNMPPLFDLFLMLCLGFIWAAGMFLIAKAYSLAQASVAAPFEYVTLPINVIWGYLIWSEIPVLTTWVGAGLTLSCGLYILFRETQLKQIGTA